MRSVLRWGAWYIGYSLSLSINRQEERVFLEAFIIMFMSRLNLIHSSSVSDFTVKLKIWKLKPFTKRLGCKKWQTTVLKKMILFLDTEYLNFNYSISNQTLIFLNYSLSVWEIICFRIKLKAGWVIRRRWLPRTWC